MDINKLIFLGWLALAVVLIGAMTFGLAKCWGRSRRKDRMLDVLFLLSLWQWPVWMMLYAYGLPPTDSSVFWDIVTWPSLTVPFLWCVVRTHPIA